MVKQLTKKTVKELKTRFNTPEGFIGSFDNPKIFCPHVNGLTSICLEELGHLKEAKNSTIRFLNSNSYNEEQGLFYREVDTSGKIIVSEFNCCKNAIFAINLFINGFEEEAKKILENIIASPLLNPENKLFFREYNSKNNKVSPLILTQTNLWASWTYIYLNKHSEAKKIIKSLEKARYDKNMKLFSSQDCRDLNSKTRFFLDDQAIAILVYLKLGQKSKAKKLMKGILGSSFKDENSGLFNSSFSEVDVDNTKSSYKNSFMAFALGKLGFKKELKYLQKSLIGELYDSSEGLFNQTTKDKIKIPDNSALALCAIEYKNLKHRIF